jgi:hypothetical protein
MQTVTVEITDIDAMKTLHELEARHLIKIIDEHIPGSPSMPGSPLELQAFESWVENAENSATVDLTEAKLQWANKRKQLKQAAGKS